VIDLASELQSGFPALDGTFKTTPSETGLCGREGAGGKQETSKRKRTAPEFLDKED